MSKYIDAEKLKAEIERLSSSEHPVEYDSTEKLAYNRALSEIEDSIDSLQQEQPEVDLKKEIECSIRFLNGHHTLENGERWYKGRYEELKDFAHHFWNKGYNARKEERK